MSQKEYRAAEGISRSELFTISKSPLHFKYQQDHPKEDTKALKFGRAVHKYILENEDFYNDYAVEPVCDRRTKEGKEAYQIFLDELWDKESICEEDLNVIKEMYAAVQSNPLAAALLTGEHEKDFFWIDEETGEKCKCRPDCLTEYEGKKYIVDYKSTDSCEDGHFERSCRKYGYKFQAGMYREGVFQNTYEDYGFAFVAQEKTAPYAVRVYICSEEFINEGYDIYRELLGTYHYCKENGNWYGYEGITGYPDTLVGEGEIND